MYRNVLESTQEQIYVLNRVISKKMISLHLTSYFASTAATVLCSEFLPIA